MYELISLSSYILDMIIITSYFNSVLKKKKDYFAFYYLVLVLTEGGLYINETFVSGRLAEYGNIVTTLVSIVSTVVLTLFYCGSFLVRIFTAIAFQVLASVSEYLFTFAVQFADRSLLSESNRKFVVAVMNAGSKVVLLLFVILISLFWKSKKNHPVEYNILQMATPVISLVIFVTIPSAENMTAEGSATRYLIIILCIVLLNICNYILINRTYAVISDNAEKEHIRRQMKIQEDKYLQLSELYKQSRRIIHDAKKHYFTIGQYAEKNDDLEISNYISSALKDIETTYVRYNTGNLVIDSMLSTYDNVASRNGVSLSAELHVDYMHVPVKDYDLSIIIGNIMDNAIAAASGDPQGYIKVRIETRDDLRFIIMCENSVAGKDAAFTPDADVTSDHGYGLPNIEKTVEKYYGFMSIASTDPWITQIVIPILTDKSSFSVF